MGKRETLEKKLDKLTRDFDEGHKKLEALKKEMQKIRQLIKVSPTLSEERLDEILLKS